MIGKRGQREILAQIKVWKTQEYFVYFGSYKRKSWSKIRYLPQTVMQGVQAADDMTGKRGWREILAQIKVWKTQEYFVYFGSYKRKSWGKRSAIRRRRSCQRLPRKSARKQSNHLYDPPALNRLRKEKCLQIIHFYLPRRGFRGSRSGLPTRSVSHSIPHSSQKVYHNFSCSFDSEK